MAKPIPKIEINILKYLSRNGIENNNIKIIEEVFEESTSDFILTVKESNFSTITAMQQELNAGINASGNNRIDIVEGSNSEVTLIIPYGAFSLLNSFLELSQGPQARQQPGLFEQRSADRAGGGAEPALEYDDDDLVADC
ncbi:hypothetical protein ACGP04_03010 [Piscirickettsia salmonis]|uniref:hypothetical protein n=1 Tax=Piscirickettsia salmonis TaxID=1238 RepID=UPI000F087F68|nr:hypothetical protein DA717_12225 [Piscirickettsiaceae bacterium NZ-RLO2]